MGKMEVYQKLLAVQSELKAPKNLYNIFGKYYYRNAESILEAAKPLLKQVGAVLVVTDTIEAVGNRIYVRATAVFTDPESMEQVSCSACAREEETKKGMDASQITGAASSYARKYALNGLFCLDDNKDADALPQDHSQRTEKGSGSQRGNSPSGRNQGGSSQGTAGGQRVVKEKEALVKAVLEEICRTRKSSKYFLELYHVEKFADMRAEDLETVWNTLQGLPDYQEKGR